MTQELQSLASYLGNKLTSVGISDVTKPWCKDCNWTFELNSMTSRKKNSYGTEGLCGFDIRMDQVHRNNDAKENTSLRVEIMEWNYSSGHGVFNVKIGIHDSGKKKDRLIQQVIDEYLRIAKEKGYEV